MSPGLPVRLLECPAETGNWRSVFRCGTQLLRSPHYLFIHSSPLFHLFSYSVTDRGGLGMNTFEVSGEQNDATGNAGAFSLASLCLVAGLPTVCLPPEAFCSPPPALSPSSSCPSPQAEVWGLLIKLLTCSIKFRVPILRLDPKLL